MSDHVVEFSGLTKRYGEVVAVQDVSFAVGRGRVVGLLGRNGAGKTTLLRTLLGLARPDAGTAKVFGTEYPTLPRAAHRVGVSIEPMGFVPCTTGRRELRIWATTLGLPARRVDEVLDQVGLRDAAGRKTAGYSLGMKQRLALAVALLAEPELLILDEPATGLDPDGIRWLRDTLRGFAAAGGTVVLSSHLLAEVEQTVDDVVILQQSLRYVGSLDELTESGTRRLEECFFELVGTKTEKVNA